jgi:predicted nuclease of restriction endonuclease-like (RecB) superfamily
LQSLIAKLPWGHNLRVLDRIKDRPTREWYLRAALEYGWSQDVLVLQIKSRLHEREGKALTNFRRELPPPESDMAEQILKDPYNFDFLTVTEAAKEREIERGLLTHLRDLLLELGRGFSFVGSQVPLTVDGQTYYLDLLFYRPLAPLFRLRIKGGCLPTRTCRQAGLLPCGGERHDANAGRRTEHRSSAVREPERPHRGICS